MSLLIDTAAGRSGAVAARGPACRRPARCGSGRSRPVAPSPVRGVTACTAPYRRRQAGWLAGLASVAAVVVIALGTAGQATAGAPVPTSTTMVQVQPGEGLWDLARRSAPGADPAAVVRRIRLLNHLDSAMLVPGTPLRVPAGTGGSRS